MGPLAGNRVAVFVVKLGPDVGMQRDVEWLHLVPQPIDFFGEILGGHIVLGTPHGPVVLESQFACALVGELDVACEVEAHGTGDGVPAGPGIEQLCGIAVVDHELAELFEIAATVRAIGAILAFAVSALHAGEDAGQVGALLGIGGSGDGERELQQFHLSIGDRIEFQAIEFGGLLGVVDRGIDGALIELGGDGFGIVGDVGGLDPIGAR